MSRVPPLRVGVALTAALISLLALAGSASATISATRTYQCLWPLIGTKSLSVDYTVGVPQTAALNQEAGPFGVVADVTSPDTAPDLAAINGAWALDGDLSTSLSVDWPSGAGVRVPVTSSVGTTYPPFSGTDSLQFQANGVATVPLLPEEGTQTLSIEELQLNLMLRDNADVPIALPPLSQDLDGNPVSDSDGSSATFDVYCKLDTGQSSTVGTFEVAEPTPTPTPGPSTPTPTPGPPTATPLPGTPSPLPSTPRPTTTPLATPTPRPATPTPSAPTPVPTPPPTAGPTPVLTPTPVPADRTPPTRPGAIAIDDADIGTTFINLRWKASSDSGTGLKEYVIEYGGGEVERIAANRTSARIIGLRPDRTYTFTIRAIDVAGNESEPLKYTIRTRAEAEQPPGGGGGPGPTPSPPPGGGPPSTGAVSLRSVTFSGRLGRPSRSSRREFVVLSRKPAGSRTPVLKVVLSRPAALRISLAQRRAGGVYKTVRGASVVGARSSTVYLRPTGSWGGKIIPRGTYRLRVVVAGGDQDDLVLRFR